MPISRNIPVPRRLPARWLAGVGKGLPEEVQTRLRSSLASSFTPMIAAGANATVLCLVGYLRTEEAVFLALAAAEMLLLGFRYMVFRTAHRSSDLWFLCGLVWPALHGLLVAVAIATGDFGLTAVVLVSALGAICVLVSRHFAAPRYALAQSALIEAGFLLALALYHPDLLPIVLLQLAAFCIGKVAVLRQLRGMTIQAITSEIASREQSITDPLTHLLNRRGLEAEFARRQVMGVPISLFYLDLDGFKKVNDSLGHSAGDTLLEEVAERLRESCRGETSIARMGGDEFLILAELARDSDMLKLGRRIVARLGEPYQLRGVILAKVGVSIGAARWDPALGTLPALIAQADRALYAAKGAGRGRCITFASLDAKAAETYQAG
ncbi:GGDEF domain-containing protein [Rubellimicrobium rubrum]|uniref:GGDEF domain-containing protein n=1 Tax=Rubellimicrobium rubrum TaxID=2585369 RepID=A0A5C4MNM2_9RHOB|nr:GGDEF domain-containing protein [Rubellimicrobium rubrum]TNC47428.1 GGDEF domain-containing protein [Rubellimicrobium rubrum]